MADRCNIQAFKRQRGEENANCESELPTRIKLFYERENIAGRTQFWTW